MKKFEITFTKDTKSGIYSANLVNATSAEQATAYYTAQGYTVAGCTETTSDPKTGAACNHHSGRLGSPEKRDHPHTGRNYRRYYRIFQEQ